MTIVGNGDIAAALKEVDRPDRIFFASGVSNSGEQRESEYQREKELLLSQKRSRYLVYMSSLCVFYSDTRYARHKRYMEELVKKTFPLYTIMRMGNISWGVNPTTLINFLRNKIKNDEPCEIQDVYRYVLDKDEFLHWIGMIPSDWSCEVNVPGKMMKVKDIVREFCPLGVPVNSYWGKYCTEQLWQKSA